MLFQSFPSFPTNDSASSLKLDPERAFSGGYHTYIPFLTLFSLTFDLSISSSIVEEAMALRDAGLGLTAYYYFDFRYTSKQNVRGLLSSLLVQLCAKSDPCYKILARLYTTYDNGSRLPEDEALVQCLKDMLELPEQPPIYLIMDALDECPRTSEVVSPRDRVFDLIEDLVGLNLPNLRICVTSRPEADIHDVLQPLASHTVSLHDEDGQKEDINKYITSVVQSDRTMRRWNAQDKNLVIDTLTQKADGMYVVIITYINLFI